MDYFLSFGPVTFVAVKITAVSVSLLYLDKRLKGTGRKIFSALLLVYAGVVAWHITNLISIL